MSGQAAAQDSYPNRPVTLVVPQPPGGTNDIIGRFVAEKLGEKFGGARFIVENRAGAGGMVGTASAARAAPDGYTLLLTISASQAIGPALYAKASFDPVNDFEPITLLARTGFVLVAHPSLNVSSMAELLELGRKQGELQYGSAGNGTMNHLLGEMLRSKSGLRLVHVPFRGVGPMLNDMLGGHVKLGFASVPSVLAHLQSGALKPLGVSSAQRDKALPEVPTVGEAVPGFAGDLWVALFAPKRTPKPLIDRLLTVTREAMNEPAMREKLAAQGAHVETSDPQGLAIVLKDDLAKWAEVVRESGAKVD
ncbi:MAG TPA: tripartite tricarboxylate transporter substrate binding protein [Bosea sp. (in: a-proteobacteria)]|uniref:Bug family tripartite tricarboxylate transporter substrate binding protein n=1 Tax=Bosea sp. (in: a-proteobacteria) TaxID=1871050 RepID=UPI002E0FE631|nr:tripartite tricarboxylate transporter substrate binding protein [Bosea sp. (in: a-proteobacteria)]